MLTPIEIELEDSFMIFKYVGSDNIITKTKKNLFEENTGLTILNPDFNIPAYLLSLDQFGTNIECGHIIDNIVGYLKNADMENILLVIDFSNIIDISENFAEQYTRFLLSTKSKVLSINQNTNINIAISSYIESIIDIQEMKQWTILYLTTKNILKIKLI